MSPREAAASAAIVLAALSAAAVVHVQRRGDTPAQPMMAVCGHAAVCRQRGTDRVTVWTARPGDPPAVGPARQLPGEWAAVLPVHDQTGAAIGAVALGPDGSWHECSAGAPPTPPFPRPEGAAGAGETGKRPALHGTTIPLPVHAAFARRISGRTFALLLAGGDRDDPNGRLLGARVVVCEVNAGRAEVLWDELDPGLNPWLLRPGQADGESLVLIGVYRQTRFDPAARNRPFVYRLEAEPVGLGPVWLGSLLSRSFEAAEFADLTGDGVDELVALEHAPGGGLSLAAYSRQSFGFDALARTEDIGSALPKLRRGQLNGRDVVCVCLRRAGGQHYEAFGFHGGRLMRMAGTPRREGSCADWVVAPWAAAPVIAELARGRLRLVTLARAAEGRSWAPPSRDLD